MSERILAEVLELDVDRCDNDYGVSPCTAGIEETGTAQAGTATTLQLRAGASAVDDAYNGMTARLTDGPGSIQDRRVSDYDGVTKVATVESSWAPEGSIWPDYESHLWQDGVNPTGYGLNQSVAGESTWATKAGPYGDNEVVNVCIPKDQANSGDGGWAMNANPYPAVDHTKSHLFAVFMKRLVNNGSAYWGLHSNSPTGHVSNLNDTTNTNPYFYNATVGTAFPNSDTWYLVIGFMHASDYAGADLGIAGVYDLAGNKVRDGTEFKWFADTTGARHRAYHFYNNVDDEVEAQYIARPRVFECASADAAALIQQLLPPDATTTYDIIDRANACYKTYRTCQDKPNYVKGVQTIRFTGRGAPIDPSAPARPYITAIDTAPTELDLEECVSRRALSTVSMLDAPDSDVEMDPYVRDRATPAGGTFWRRFFARNLAYSGRPARIKRAFVTEGVFGAWTTERFILDKATGPSGSGEVRLTLKDPIKLLDRATVPLPTSGKLAVALGVNDLSLTLDSGKGADYAATGWVRINDEIIRYSGNAGDVLSWPNGTYRAQFGTAAAAHDLDDGVQQCYVVEDAAFSAVVEQLHNLGGIDSADLDLAGLASEESTWLASDFRITNVCISDPEDLPALMKELMQPAGMVTWWSPIEQKVKFKVVAPASPAAIALTVLDDTGEIMDASVSLAREEDLRITLAAVNFARVSAIAEQDEAKSYRRTEIAVDLDAESANEYDERRVLQISSRFYGPDNTRAMRTFVARYVARHRDAPERIEFLLDPKDGAHKEGDLVDVETYSLVDSSGEIRTARVLITRRQSMGTQVKYAGRITTFDRPYAFIAPNGTPDYPNANGYACISQNDGLMTNGDPGALII